MPDLYCKANVPYSFHTSDSLVEIVINHQEYEVRAGKDFTITFEEDTVINDIDFYFSGIYFKSGILHIWENRKSGTQLLFLKPNEYSDLLLKVNKGIRLDIPRQKDLYYLGYFKGDSLDHELLVKNDDDYYFRFWNDYNIRFKAAEVPFVMVFNPSPEVEKLKFNDVIVGNAYYMEAGDIIITNIWLDEGDNVIFDQKYNSFGNWLIDRIQLTTGNDNNWSGLSGFSDKYYYSNGNGFMQIKCLKNTVLNFIKIVHNKSWSFELEKDEIKKIEVFKGDQIEYHSDSRYYVNNELKESNMSYNRDITIDGFIEFKGSIVKDNIYVKVLKRWGF